MSDQAATGEVSEVPVVPCTEPHDSEVYFSYTIPDADTFPGTSRSTSTRSASPSSRRSPVLYESSGLSLTCLSRRPSRGMPATQLLCTWPIPPVG